MGCLSVESKCLQHHCLTQTLYLQSALKPYIYNLPYCTNTLKHSWQTCASRRLWSEIKNSRLQNKCSVKLVKTVTPYLPQLCFISFYLLYFGQNSFCNFLLTVQQNLCNFNLHTSTSFSMQFKQHTQYPSPWQLFFSIAVDRNCLCSGDTQQA